MWNTRQIDGVGQEFVASDGLFQFGSVRMWCGTMGEERRTSGQAGAAFYSAEIKGLVGEGGAKKEGVARGGSKRFFSSPRDSILQSEAELGYEIKPYRVTGI